MIGVSFSYIKVFQYFVIGKKGGFEKAQLRFGTFIFTKFQFIFVKYMCLNFIFYRIKISIKFCTNVFN